MTAIAARGRDAMEDSSVRIESRTAASRIASWLAITGGVVIATLLAGVGVAAILARQGGSEEWRTWSDVGQTFGVLSSIISGLALLAVIMTARQNRAELERQRQSLDDNRAELRRTSHASLGLLHHQLMKMSIDDEELDAVWPVIDGDMPAKVRRQFRYAHMIYMYQFRALRSDDYTEEAIDESLRYLFSSPVMRAYWRTTEEGRRQLDPQGIEFAFAKRVGRICSEYDQVVARTTRTTTTSPTLAPDRADSGRAV